MSGAAAPAGGKVSEVVARVEAELARIWAPAEDAPVKVRASMMNFVVVAGVSEVEGLREATEHVAQTHPGRVFLAALDGRAAPWELSTEVTALCRAEGEELICSDRIELTFGAMVAARAASVIGALSLREVPTVVEVARGAASSLVDPLAFACQRLIVDSSHTPWSRIAELARRSPAPLADRNFVRAFSWRELVARFFDEVPQALGAIRRLEIGRVPGGMQEPAALFLGWLSSRLGWTVESATAARARSGAVIEIALTDAALEGVAPGEVTGLWFETAADGAPLRLACEREGEARVVRWSMSGAREAMREHPLGFRDEHWVLVKALDTTVSDAVYREAALAAAEWVRALGA